MYNAAFDLVNRNLKNNSTKLAFIDDDSNISYLEIANRVQNFAYSLEKENLEKGDKIIICTTDSINYPIVFLGAIWAGIIPVCLNTLLPKKDLKYMLEDSGAKAIICDKNLHRIFIEISNEIDHDLKIFIDADNDDGQSKNLASMIIFEDAKKIEPFKTNSSDECFWLYSSGSTGAPKGTIHAHGNLLETANTYAKNILQISSKDICFSAAKLFFAYGLGNSLTFSMSVGATTVLTRNRVTPSLVIDIIKKNNISIFFGVPTLYAALLNIKLNKTDFSSLRLSVSAGEALPANLYKRWKKIINTEILDGIGSTEMLHIFISNNQKKVFPGCSGYIVPGYEAKLLDENGKKTKVGDIGDLYVKGRSAAISYWKKPEISKKTFINGWVKTGDKYLIDHNNVYTYCGRSDDMMKVSGQYVSPFEVEAALLEHDSVLEAAVVAWEDEDNLIKPKAYIILKENFIASEDLENDLTNFIKKTLTPFKYPRWYEFVKELPKTATGKIQRFKLRQS